MTARTVPTPPSFAVGEELTSTKMNLIQTWMNFWSNPPMVKMHQGIAQSLANATFAQITMDTLDWDTDSGRAGGTPWSYTIPAGMTGRWKLSWKVGFASNATGVRAAQLYRNGTALTEAEFIDAAANGAASYVLGTTTESLNAGDVMAVYGYQNSGGALNTDVFSFSFLEAQLISLATP